MSYKAISWAKATKTGSPTLKALLLCLADYADENHSCFPGQALLADETEQSVRTVRRQLVELETKGLIVREHRTGAGGHRTSDRFTLQIPSGQSVRMEVPSGHPRSFQADTVVSGEPLVEPPDTDTSDFALIPAPVEAKTAEAEMVEGFDRWYAEYPRHDKIGTARTAYKSALKKTNAITLLAGASAMRRKFPDKKASAFKFCPLPASWLNAESWADESLNAAPETKQWAGGEW